MIGIAAVVVELDEDRFGSTYIDAQSVHVELEYLPLENPNDAYDGSE